MRKDSTLQITPENTLEIIQRLAFAAEYKNPDGLTHIYRISYYTELLARTYGLSKDDCVLMRLASPLHDIGKVGIPDSILLKPGKLSPEEWEMMKTHTTIGATLLADSSSSILQAGQTIAISHHERWDGTGYPQGLQGETIPVFGRIMALVDVFDALTTDRPYEKACPVDEAAEVITLGSEMQFDPRLVELFKQLLPKFLKIKRFFSDKDRVETTQIFSEEDISRNRL